MANTRAAQVQNQWNRVQQEIRQANNQQNAQAPAAAPLRPAGDQVAPPPPDEVGAAEPNIIDDLDLIN